LVELLKDEFSKELVEEAANRFVKASVAAEEEDGEGAESSGDQEDSVSSDTKKLAVAPWVTEEIRVLCRIIDEVKKEGLSSDEKEKALKKLGKSVGKGKDKKTLTENDCLDIALETKISKRIEEKLSELRCAIGKALDVVLSGRMATSGLMLSVDGALAVAHAITTHAVEPQDVDWFTAVDDLTQDAGESGAGHLNTQQFSSGVFYRYASLNLKQLQVNLGLIPDMKSEETGESRNKALEIAKHVFHLFTSVVPSAKQQSFAAHNLADFALVSFSDQPISLANAFEKPIQTVRNSGYLRPSVHALVAYWHKIKKAYGIDEQTAAFFFDDSVVESAAKDEVWPTILRPFTEVAKMKAWIAGDGNES
jgi:CRISPR system Cascade subunit CasC